MPNNTTLSNSSGFNLDSTKLSPFDGKLVPVHPEEFIEQAEQYFMTQPTFPDNVKINYIKSKFIEGARLWYTTLLPHPTNYQDFLLLFRNHFWSTNQQRAISAMSYIVPISTEIQHLCRNMPWIGSVRPGSYNHLSIRMKWLTRSLPISHLIFP